MITRWPFARRVTGPVRSQDTASNALTPDALTYAQVTASAEAASAGADSTLLTSQICRQSDFETPSYRHWAQAIRETPYFHRKQWEFCYIARALYERGMLRPGRRGLGFGVGTEPLPDLFASLGAKVLATDQDVTSANEAGWIDTNQHANSVDHLNARGICARQEFAERVSFSPCDMNAIPKTFDRAFDFCWSACCLEHLGSLKHGADFILNSMETLRPGGIAVHTTEFNLSSNFWTVQSKSLSIYRRRDIEKIIRRLEKAGFEVEPMDWSPGQGLVDGYIDLPPYRSEPHIKLRIDQYDCTSIGLIIKRPL